MTKLFSIVFIIAISSCATNPDTDTSNKPKEEIKNTDSNGIITYSKPTENLICESYSSDFAFIPEKHTIYFSQKVDSVVFSFRKKAKENNVNLYDTDYFDAIEIQKLSINELLYYCMRFPADFAQICSLNLDRNPLNMKKIYAYLPFRQSDYEMSSVQVNELNRRRKEVLESLQKFFSDYPNQIKRDYIEILLHIKAWEIIPDIIKYASKDQLVCYTFLLEIMHEFEYSKFKKSKIYPLMYGENIGRFSAGIGSTIENRNEIIKLAKSFYKLKNEK